MMRTKFIWLAFCCLTQITLISAQEGQFTLDNIEAKLGRQLGMSLASSSDQLSPSIDQLQQYHQTTKSALSTYWLAYAHYQKAIYHITLQQMEASKAANDNCIKLLSGLKDKDAEAHVLLGTALGMSIAFEPGQAMILSSKSNKHINKAQKLAPNNLRVYLCLGRSDFYRPVEYGGGKVCEQHLLKAISLPDKDGDLAHAPSWGKDEAYLILIDYYTREGRDEDAMLYCQQAMKKYPNHFAITEKWTSLQD